MALANNTNNTLVTPSNYINCFEEFKVKFEVTPVKAAARASLAPKEIQLWINHWKLNVLEFFRHEIRENFSYKLSVNELIDKLVEQGAIRHDSVGDRSIFAATTKSRRELILRHNDEHLTFYNSLWVMIEVYRADYLQNHEDGPWRTCPGSAVDDARHLVTRRRAYFRKAELKRRTQANGALGQVDPHGSGGTAAGTSTGELAINAQHSTSRAPHGIQRSISNKPIRKYEWMRQG